MLVMYVHKTTWSDKAGVFTRVLGSGIKNWTGKGWKDERTGIERRVQWMTGLNG